MAPRVEKKKKPTIGEMRYTGDIRQIAALMLLTGFCSIIVPLPTIAKLIGKDGTTAKSGIELAKLFGSLILCIVGVLAVFAGYNHLVHDWGHKKFTKFMLYFTQLAFIPYLTDIVGVALKSQSSTAFIPEGYDPTPAESYFVGGTGIVGIFCYGFAYVGSIAFMQFAIYAYQSGRPEERCAPYYRGRSRFYCLVLLVAGLSQLMLGAYIQMTIGGNVLSEGPVMVAMFVVNFPVIAIFVGTVQVLMGLWGITRSFGIGVFGTNDNSFQVGMFLAWFIQLLLQIIVQISYNGPIAAPATIAAISVGLNLMPAFLDYKSRVFPEEIVPEEYYDLVIENTETGEEQQQEHEQPKESAEFSNGMEI